MISKFSVKKAYTVLVGIVLIIVLGIVAAMRMTTDLLPSMELPYAIIITTYAGASPETVETVVTRPIESSVATLDNVKNIGSTSSENYSMVMIEFSGEVNMDSATIDIRENLDQLQSFWPDSVGNPIIMKLNPDMMPAMVAAVDVDGMDAVALSNYVNDTLSEELEGINGVASVTAMGSVTESVEVTISEAKLKKLNDKIIKALDKKFAEAEDEINENEDKIDDGQKQLDNAKDKARDQLNDAIAMLNDMKLDLLKNELELTEALKQIIAAEEELANAKKTLTEQKTTLETTITQLETLYGQYQALAAQKAALEEQLKLYPDNAELQAQYAQIVGAMQMIEQGLAAQQDAAGNPLTIDSLPATISSLKAALKEVKAGLKEIKKSEKEIASKKKQINDALKEITDGKVTLNDKLKELEKSKDEAEEQFIQAEVELNEGKTALEQARDQFEEQKDASYESLDMKSILTIEMVEGMLTAENFSMPAGYVTEDTVKSLGRVGDKFTSIEELSDFVLLDLNMDDVEPIKLSDVADVSFVNDADESYVRINQNPGMVVSIAKQNGYSTSEVAHEINKKFEEISADDSGVHFVALMDQGIYIDMIVNSVLQNLAFGAVLAILILFVFLKDIRPTGIIAVSIPVSVVFAVVLMYFSGVTLNVISLSGLALGVGMLVDNSIVVIENIYRLRDLGYSRKQAAIEGAKRVTGAITASTATTVSVFVPIIFTDGLTRMLFVDMALTIFYSLFASLIIAITFVPMMASRVLKEEKQNKNKILNWITDKYTRLLGVALKYKAVVFVIVLVALVASVMLAVTNGTALMPGMDSTQMSMAMTMPEGTTDLKETAAMSDEIISRVLEIEDIEFIGAITGGSSMSMLGLGSDSSVDNVSYYILCKEDKIHTNEEISQMIVEKTKDLECEVSVSASSMDMSALGASGVVINVKGKELDELARIADEVAAKLEEVEGLTEVSNGQEEVTSEVRFVVDKDKAAGYGLTVAQVYQKVAGELAAQSAVTKLETVTRDYEVFVTSSTKEEMTVSRLKNLTIEGTVDNEKEDIKLSQMVDFKEAEGLTAISRSNQNRYISVSAAIMDGYNAGLLAADVEAAIKEVSLPEGYTVEFNGENETTMEAMEQVGLMLLLAVIFMYLIMVIQFQSLLSPFIIMFTLPLAFTGGFMGLYIAGMEVSVIAMIGMVMLAGVIVNNGIVLVDAINQTREEGVKKKEAIMQSAKDRLRPVIMTALTTILGLSTMAAGMGMGADMAQPMAVVVIGGLIYGTLLTLFLVPCIYDVFNRKELVMEEDINGTDIRQDKTNL
ncbi:MAG: efflux RND transporter permease subunit [Lachnospiraceae bacterium]|nr:efflux RND transporter permease subunit [Lachnospiraceae bacterium]